ncbi:hypothetical protein [Nostoc sp. T09]|uniref:hypothetical protein n=1 Tax=Nostoc sp. T09 TaxID=1932621 RepID=UPI00117CBC83|nr:hypothetical protein [Nostoc sp. T09]
MKCSVRPTALWAFYGRRSRRVAIFKHLTIALFRFPPYPSLRQLLPCGKGYAQRGTGTSSLRDATRSLLPRRGTMNAMTNVYLILHEYLNQDSAIDVHQAKLGQHQQFQR